MTALAFAPLHNSNGKKDATGAFQPEASKFCMTIPAATHLILVDNHLPAAKMRAFVLATIAEHKPDRLAFFCHGWATGIQFGFGLAHIKQLAEAIATIDRPIVTLFCCLTGKDDAGHVGGDGHFADRLRDALCAAGAVECRVDAHTTAGHTTMNPHVRRFDGLGSPIGGCGGQWIVAPGSKLWPKWKAALRGDLRFRFSEMEIGEIHEEVNR